MINIDVRLVAELAFRIGPPHPKGCRVGEWERNDPEMIYHRSSSGKRDQLMMRGHESGIRPLEYRMQLKGSIRNERCINLSGKRSKAYEINPGKGSGFVIGLLTRFDRSQREYQTEPIRGLRALRSFGLKTLRHE